MKRKILFIGPHRPNRSPSQRFRMEQYFPFLESAGFHCDYSWFIDEKDDHVFYSDGNLAGKLGIFLKSLRIRMGDLIRRNQYDVIFIQREAFMTGSVFFEKQFSHSRASLIFDFDDAIWLADTSSANRKLNWLKNPGKTSAILRMADAVIAGNSFLADFAKQFNTNVHIIPTVIDTDIFIPVKKQNRLPVMVGWSGSLTTQKHFDLIIPVLKKLKEKFRDDVQFIKIGGETIDPNILPIEHIPWNLKNEVAELRKIDIGLMPLPDTDWARGKCGFKALQYMALEIPAVISPVGVNSEIVQQGVNGFLALPENEWMDSIGKLIESFDLRRQIGNAARQTVVEKYSVQAQLPALISILENARKRN